MMLAIRSQFGRSSCGSRMLSNHASCTAPCRISEATRWRQVLVTSVPSARCSCVALRAPSAAAPILRTVSVSRRKCSRAANSRSPSLSSCSHCPVREYCPRARLFRRPYPCGTWSMSSSSRLPPCSCLPLLHVCIGLPYSSTYGHFCPLRPAHGPCSSAFGWVVVVDLGRDHGDS
jgi:hypothetical protein